MHSTMSGWWFQQVQYIIKDSQIINKRSIILKNCNRLPSPPLIHIQNMESLGTQFRTSAWYTLGTMIYLDIYKGK